MPQRNDRSRSTPTTSPKNNSWFRMQAGHQSDADIYIYDEIGLTLLQVQHLENITLLLLCVLLAQ